jgi:hypothetical protein
MTLRWSCWCGEERDPSPDHPVSSFVLQIPDEQPAHAVDPLADVHKWPAR